MEVSQRCLFCQEECPGEEDGVYVCRGTREDSQGLDDPVAHLSCVAWALIREPGAWHWWAFPPEADADPQRNAEYYREVRLLRSLTLVPSSKGLFAALVDDIQRRYRHAED